MKKVFLLCTLFCLTIGARAQMKIGFNVGTIDFASILELENPNKALYLTRVFLTSTSDITTVPNPKAGMTVYNINGAITGSCATGVGVYYFDGTTWVSENACAAIDSIKTQAWLLKGNAGTIDGVNFLGTTDAVPFNLRVNNQVAGRVELPSTGNTSLGYQTLMINAPNIGTGAGLFNTAMGGYALNVNTSGRRNSAFGYDALGANTTGDSNTAVGFGALQVNTTGFNNTATGAYSLNHNTTGKFNTAVGYEALHSNVIDSGSTAVGAYALYNSNGGKGNVAMGLAALFANLTGSFNTVVGTSSMRYSTVSSGNATLGTNAGYNNGVLSIGGNNNTFLGTSADSSNISGNNITAVGYQSGYTNGGSNNTFVGSNADGTIIPLTWAGAFGANAKVTTSNSIALGATDAGSTPARTQSAFVGINVTDPTQRIDFRNGHLRNRQDVVPGTSVTTGNGVTVATVSPVSSDVRGQIITTGQNNASGYTVVHVTFTYTCTNIPIIVITAANQTAAYNDYYVDASTTGFDLYFRAPFPGLAAANGAVYNYMIME